VANGFTFDGGSSGGLSVAASHSQGTLRFYAGSNSERMRIAANGRVGIGTTSPAGLLHVAGDAQVDGNLAGPTITALTNSLAALTARVARLESGQVVDADLVGVYEVQFFGVQLLGNPARIGMEQFAMRFTLNADHTATVTATGGDCDLLQGTPWAVTCESGTESGSATWSVQDDQLLINFEDGDQAVVTIGAGGRVLISGGISEFEPGAGFANIAIAIRVANP
jgi:hypothetical protein